MHKGSLRQYNVRTGELISDYDNECVYTKSNYATVPYVAQLEDSRNLLFTVVQEKYLQVSDIRQKQSCYINVIDLKRG